MNHQQESKKDELRARFTGWLEVTLYRAKLNYLKKQDRERNTIYVEALPEELVVEENSEPTIKALPVRRQSVNSWIK